MYLIFKENRIGHPDWEIRRHMSYTIGYNTQNQYMQTQKWTWVVHNENHSTAVADNGNGSIYTFGQHVSR